MEIYSLKIGQNSPNKKDFISLRDTSTIYVKHVLKSQDSILFTNIDFKLAFYTFT